MPKKEAYEPVTLKTLGDLRRFMKEIEDFPDDTEITGSYEARVPCEVVTINGGWPPNTMPSVWIKVFEEVEEVEEEA